MKLLPRELESLLIHQAGCVAQKRLARGLKLNYPESVALISCQILELARDGCSTVSELMGKGQHILGKKQVMEGVADLIQDLQVEATFPDGTKLVSMNYPICREHGDLNLALYGSFLPVPSLESFEADIPNLPEDDQEVSNSPPGCIYPAKDEDIELNKGKEKVAVVVQSLCDRPIQVGSHFNFVEVNKDLVFDRALAYGKRLNIPAGNAIRFEPGITKTVTLVDISGKRVVRGGNNLCDGPVNSDNLAKVMKKVVARGFGNKIQLPVLEPETCFITRYLYSRTYGPTTGDKVRLGDTSLVLEVEKDFTVYGEECKFGGGKVVREGMGQASQISCHAALDVVITSCVIIDAIQRIIKADIGIKDGKIVGIGKAGNDDVMDDVTPGMLIGAGTDIVAGDGYILTAGGIDCHVHFICPQLIKNAITSGITTMVGGGTGPTSGSCASTCTFGIHHMRSMIQSTEAFPMNFGFTGEGNTSKTDGLSTELVEQIQAGAIGLKLHEDWGSTPSAIDTALKVAEAYDVQIAIHTDTLNESCSLEDTVKAFNGRTIHAYHVEGSGGGHAPDIISICKEFNVIPSSTNPTRPYTVNTVDEQYDMLMICHHLDKNLKTDVAFAESRIRAETISAEDVLHDIGAISIIASDSQGMGRIGEVITRTWQTADKMKKQHGRLPEDNGDNDNFRILRYISKYTINPAIAHGLSHVVGSIEIGKLADLVLWKPAFFGVKPHMILKSGQVAWAQMGNPNATIPTPQPVVFRKMFGAYGKCTGANSVIFVSKASIELGNVQRYGISKTIVPVFGIRKIGKKDMLYNNLLPKIKVNPETFKVYIKGEMKPAGENERKETGENELKEEGKNELKEAGKNELKVAEENELKEVGDNELEEAGENELKEAGENELKEAGENELKESWEAMKERKEMKEKKEVWREITCSPVSSLPLAQRYSLF